MFDLTGHIRRQAQAKGIAIAAVEAVLAAPEITYKSFRKDAQGNRYAPICEHHNVQQEKWTGNGVCVVVYPCCRKAITVWADQVETPLRPDQIRAGVTSYHDRNGRRRS